MTTPLPIPHITKFNSNVVLYDSLGYVYNNYIHFTYDKENIYFLMNENGYIIGFNTITEEISSFNIPIYESVYSIIKHNNSIYGFGGYEVKNFVEDTVLYIKDNNKLVQESYVNNENKIVHLQSSSEIRDFLVDKEFNYYVIHAKNKISKFTKDRILLYSVQIKPNIDTVFNTLSVMPNDEIELFKIDYVREYTDNGLKEYPILLGKIKNGTAVLRSNEMFLAKFDDATQSVVSASFLGLTGQYYSFGDTNKINYNLTNYEFLKNQYPIKKELTFNVVLKNVYNNKDEIRVSIPISTEGFLSEYHHFAFRLDGINGKISVFCDGKEIKTVDIQKGQYIFQEIFDESINIGNTYFHNNISLNEYLQQKNYYFVNNAKLKQFKFYKKALTNNEIDFHVYDGIEMSDLVVSLPCGQRNEIDTIERQFKLDISGNKSNKINIIVKNSKITNNIIKEKLKTIIEEKLKKVLPLTTTINNIEFR